MTEREERHLVVLLEGQRAGALTEDSFGRLSFDYDVAWQGDPDAVPLSLSMPLAQRSHGDEVIRPFLWGLLPDNERVLERWGRDYQVSPRNPFALLQHVGEDCAGAVQLVAHDRVDDVTAGEGVVHWLDESEVAMLLRALHADPTAWHAQSTTGQFSLAGAQPKTALRYDERRDRWGLPSGAEPTTHILKPGVTGFDDHDVNEHLCLEVARRLGWPAARSDVMSFDGERAIVVERYDRRWVAGRVQRVHQEDMCQALARLPVEKYQSEGGPRPEEIALLLADHVHPLSAGTASVLAFVDALALNWVLGGTDAHAKNYSVLLSGPQVRLAPLYDVASALVYPDMYLPKLKMAMKVGGEYRLAFVRGRHWRRLAASLDLDGDDVVERVARVAELAPVHLAEASTGPVGALGSDLPERLVAAVTSWAGECQRLVAE